MSGILMGSYSPNDVAMTINGVPVSGFSEDSFITNKETVPQATIKQGADGIVTVTQIKGGVPGELSFKLSQTSLANNIMVSALAAQKLGVFLAIHVLNMQGGESIIYPRGVIKNTADISFGKESGDREWMITGLCVAQPAGMLV